jgi:hypothetical protein
MNLLNFVQSPDKLRGDVIPAGKLGLRFRGVLIAQSFCGGPFLNHKWFFNRDAGFCMLLILSLGILSSLLIVFDGDVILDNKPSRPHCETYNRESVYN